MAAGVVVSAVVVVESVDDESVDDIVVVDDVSVVKDEGNVDVLEEVTATAERMYK